MTELQRAIDKLADEIDGYLKTNPERWEELRKFKWQVDGLHDEVNRHRRALFKKGYY